MESTKKIIKKILVGVDGSDKSLEAADYALSIATTINQVELTMLNVLDTEPWYYGESAYGWATEDKLKEVYTDEIQKRQKILDKIKEKADKVNIQPKTKILMSPHTIGAAGSYS